MVLGEALNKGYFPIMVPLGVVGSVLSFLVSVISINITLKLKELVNVIY